MKFIYRNKSGIETHSKGGTRLSEVGTTGVPTYETVGNIPYSFKSYNPYNSIGALEWEAKYIQKYLDQNVF